MKMQKSRARDRREAGRDFVVRGALEFQRADEPQGWTRFPPAIDQAQQPLGIADDIGEQPIDRPDRFGVEREGTLAPNLDPRHLRYARIKRRLVDADDPGAQPGQRPRPAPGATAEIEASLARLRPPTEQSQRLP